MYDDIFREIEDSNYRELLDDLVYVPSAEQRRKDLEAAIGSYTDCWLDWAEK